MCPLLAVHPQRLKSKFKIFNWCVVLLCVSLILNSVKFLHHLQAGYFLCVMHENVCHASRIYTRRPVSSVDTTNTIWRY